jgi:signal peptidase I
MDNSKREQETGKQQSVTRTVVEISVYLVLFFIVVFITPKYLAHTTIVDGDSMMPCLYDKEKVILEMLSKQTDRLERFDVIVFYPYGREVSTEQYIKRIIGLPGETVMIMDNKILINGEPLEEQFALDKSPLYPGLAGEEIKLAEDEYFVLGDNRYISNDSRYRDVGNVKKENIEGRLVLIFWPLSDFGTVK